MPIWSCRTESSYELRLSTRDVVYVTGSWFEAFYGGLLLPPWLLLMVLRSLCWKGGKVKIVTCEIWFLVCEVLCFFGGGGLKMNLFLCCCSADPCPCGLAGFTKSPSLCINTQFPLSVQEITTSCEYQIVHIHCPALKSLVLGPFFKMHSHLQARNNCAFPIFTPPLLFFVTHVNKRCRTRSRDWWLSLKQ